ncbi:sigma-70 family RNA polymerase sigma factor [Eubacteriales bacterium OttesenSCG-928-A19]|nr:sigma-70 family RNA polymerase sigma factor [Eubacteriales bacterium OttesenSCG-928-A19]
MRLALTGDEEALVTLISRYRESLHYFVAGMVNDTHLAEEIVIDAFTLMMRKGGQFRGDASLKTYLFSIGRNLALRHIRYRRKVQIVLSEKLDMVVEESQIDGEILRHERDSALHAAMRSLREEYHAVLHLLYFEEMSYREAGIVLEKSEKQISNLAFRAKLALKKALESEGFIDDHG